MLTKDQLREINLEFWIEFKKFMSRTKSCTKKKINWLNYPTEIRHIYLRLQTTKEEASVCFDIQYKDSEIRAIFWEQLSELKKVLQDEMGEEGEWIENCSTEAVPLFCRIQWRSAKLNYLNPENQQQIFEFFKEKLIAFDRFYQSYKEILLFLAK